MLQRSDEWFEARRGRFTASQIHRLLGKQDLARTKQSIDSFAFEKAVETVFGIEQDQLITFDMQRGIELEPLAFAKFKDLKSFDFIDVEEATFVSYGDHAGASPDGSTSDNSNLEIKCPKRNNFFKIVGQGIIDPKYMAQMQMQMMTTLTEKTYFFNYYIEEGVEFWHEIIVQRDEAMIGLIKSRIDMAEVIKLNYINKLESNKQW